MLQWAVLSLCVVAAVAVCPRDPGSRAALRTPGDGGFKITISGDPARYVPQSVYVVSIQGPQVFRRFTLVADAISSDESDASPQRVGSYQLFGDDASVTFNPDCINTVSETRDEAKSEVRVMWSTPVAGSGCVVLRAMVFVDEYHWYADDGQLSQTICELTEKPNNLATTDECCACDQAKYTFVFEGLWSNVTHPKDFPFNLWLTHFSDLVGGSHGRNFTVWKEGGIATNALRQLAEWGSVRAMEQELRLKSKGLKTLIKAAGLWYPSVNSNTSSTFRVDRSKHLLSLISMFGPSPDWVVGVSGLNLCLPNCTWTTSKVINLFPYDAGTDNGITYMAPQTYGQWEGVHDATKEGNESIQKHFMFKTACGNEDCLYLNVYAPQEPGKKEANLAVMVWIHGGGFWSGSGSTELYGPDYLIEEEIILVTINYRCGALGFLSLENDKVPGNAGLKDQALALKWVKENIDSFGGDPNNVTIFGESAGASSVHFHLLSPYSRGLFHKAIMQSGFAVNQYAIQQKPKEKALLLAKQLGCSSEDLDTVLEFLMTVPAADIVHAQGKETLPTPFKDHIQKLSVIFGPCVEMAGEAPFLSNPPHMLMEKGQFSNIPVIMGIVNKEGLLAVMLQEIFVNEVNEDLSILVPYDLNITAGSEEERELGKKILEFYTNQDTLSWDVMLGYIDFVSDVIFTFGFEYTRQFFLKHSTPVFTYQITYTTPRAISAPMIQMAYPDHAAQLVGSGASHCDELVHLFKTNFQQVPFVPPTDDDQTFMNKLLKAWTTFAKTGNPNCKELGVTWKPDSILNPHYLELGKVWKSVNNISFPKRMEFWKKIYEKYSYLY